MLSICNQLHVDMMKYLFIGIFKIEMFYLNTIEQLFLFVEQLGQLEVFLPYSRLLAHSWNTNTGGNPKF